MASTSSSHQQNAFYGINPPNKRRKVDQSSCDVFINHRSPDVKQILAAQLHNSLQQLGIRAFIDSQEEKLGNLFPSSIEYAIRSASVHVAIFSKRYAESAWCLTELVLMLQSRSKIIPVFYQVEPWELRFIEKGVYAQAFLQYQEKGIYLDKLEEWKEALQQVSYSEGYEFRSSGSSDCKIIVSAVVKEVERRTHLCGPKYPVGLHKLVEDFERRCLDELVRDSEIKRGIRKATKEKANIVGIFGMGGVGKTTFSKELFNQKRSKYTRASFLFGVREAHASGNLPSLQSKLIRDIFCEDRSFLSCEEGASCLKDLLEMSMSMSFLIVLDDIDHVEQLEALLVMDILNKSNNNLIIITTRDAGVLVSAGIDIAYHLRELDREDARKLFCWHAFNQPLPHSGYQDLVQALVDVCGGLPLSLIVLAQHVFDRPQSYWAKTLIMAQKSCPKDILKRLKISIDTLDDEEKQIFMDIACFFVEKSITMAMTIWKGSGWNACRVLERLKQKCLVEEVEVKYLNMQGYKWEFSADRLVFKMHKHLRDLGREMADELSHPHRVWRNRHLRSLESKGFRNILARSKWRCFHSILDKSIGSEITYFLGEAEDGSDTSSLLWLELDYLGHCPFDLNSDITSNIFSWIPLQNLQCLKISNGCFRKLWQSDVQAPFQLKELQIHDTFLEEFSDLLGRLHNLEKFVLHSKDIQIDIWSLLESLRMKLRSLQMMGSRLTGELAENDNDNAEGTTCKSLFISDFKRLWEGELALNNERWSGTVMSDIENLEINGYRLVTKILINGSICQRLQSLRICEMENLTEVDLAAIKTLECLETTGCKKFKTLSAAAGDLTKLSRLIIKQCPELEELPCLYRASCLEQIEIDSCEKLQNLIVPTTISSLSVRRCRDFQRVAGTGDPMKLGMLSFIECPNLEELSILNGSDCLKVIEISSCEKLRSITLPTTVTRLSVRSCRDLQRVEGSNDLMELVEFEISDCGKLEFENTWEDKEHAPLQLKELIITGTWSGSLVRFPSSISYLSNLKKIALLGDDRKVFGIKGLPDEFCHLQSLEHLELRHCTLLSSLPSRFGDLKNLRRLDVCHCKALRMLPVTFQQLEQLKHLDLSGCKRLLLQEDTLEKIRQLENLYLSGCHALEKIPQQVADQAYLRELHLQHTQLEDLPSNIGQLSKLELLTIGSPLLRSLPDSIGNLSSLKSLSITNCFTLKSLPETLGHLALLEHLCIEATGVRSLPQGFRQLSNLRTLKISDCPLSELGFELVPSFSLEKLVEINLNETLVTRLSVPEGCCPRLETLQLSRNDNLEVIETLPATVKNIQLVECEALKKIPGILHLRNPLDLTISDCPELEKPVELASLESEKEGFLEFVSKGSSEVDNELEKPLKKDQTLELKSEGSSEFDSEEESIVTGSENVKLKI